MAYEQEQRCAICQTGLIDGNYCVDHDHGSGRVRALLCRKCNTLIGMADERCEVLAAAIAYLERFADDRNGPPT